MRAVTFFLFSCLAILVTSLANECVQECDKQYGHLYKIKFCSNHNTDVFVPFEFQSNFCYFHCNLTALYPGTCKCPNNCYSAFNQGVCTESGCKCSPQYTGRDCQQRIDSPVETTHLEPLPYGELFSSPYVDTDKYKDDHPVFNSSVISEIRIQLNPDHFTKLISPATIYENEYVECNFHFKNERINEVIQGVGIRPKGSLSRTQRKKGWKFELPKLFYGTTKISIKGQQEHLLGVQSFTSAEMFRAMGLPTHRSSFAKFYVNDIYHGLYWLQEEFETEFFESRYHKTGGFYKCGSGYASLAWEGKDPEVYKKMRVWKAHLGRWEYYYDKKLLDRKDYTSLVDLITVVNKTSDVDFPRAIEEIFNVERFLKQLIVEICIMNHDTYTNWNNNFLLYEDADQKGRLEYISHDFDLSYLFMHKMAHHNIYNWTNIVLTEMGETKPKPCPLTQRILSVPKFKKQFTQYFKVFLQRVYGTETMIKRFNYLKQYLFDDVKKDYFYSLDCIHDERFKCPRNEVAWVHEIEAIKIGIQTRRVAALQQLNDT